jgi:tRNA-Thr(GGU) m(6)t(6)A37 methyltransferase TsaA
LDFHGVFAISICGGLQSVFSMRSIGMVQSPYVETSQIPKGLGANHGAEGYLEVLPEFEAGLMDIDGFSHLFVIWLFDRVHDFDLFAKPPSDNREHGVFATRSPRRPNPIGLTVVRLLAREGARLRVSGIDMLNGTPILDIKPYLSGVSPAELRRGWLAEAEARQSNSPGNTESGRVVGREAVTAEGIRVLQAPLKERYREHPDAALITLKAEGALGDGISCKVETGKAMVEAGLHPATGGTGLQACSGDLLLQALVACAGVTLSAVSTALGIAIDAGMVRAEGDLDVRGTLGVSKETPVGFLAIRLVFELQTKAGSDEIATLIRLTERYCVIYQTLRSSPTIEVSCQFKQ